MLTRLGCSYSLPLALNSTGDELLNHEIKAKAVGRKRVRTQPEMLKNFRRYLYHRQKQPQVIRHFFREQHVRYAA